MSTSTDGHISYGILLQEYSQLPWTEDDNIEDWWRKETGYVPPLELFGPDGNWLPSVELIEGPPPFFEKKPKNAALVDAYFAAQREWDRQHPLPVKMVNTCSGDCPIWIAAVPGTVLNASRGYPERFVPAELSVNADVLATFTEFCEKYGIEGEAAWYLGSYWG